MNPLVVGSSCQESNKMVPVPVRYFSREKPQKNSTLSPDAIPLAYAGKYFAWAPNGRTIVAVASTFDAAERKAAKAGYPAAVARIPKGRTIN